MVQQTGEQNVSDEAGPSVEPFRVAVCIPAHDHVATGFALDLSRLVGYTVAAWVPKIISHLFTFVAEGTLIAPQRHGLVERALTAGATHILWLDADMRIPKDTLIRLLSHNKAIVGANYSSRRLPPRPTAYSHIGEGKGPHTNLYTKPEDSGLTTAESIGLGVCLVHTEVYRSMPMPWFDIEWDEVGLGYAGEDIYFCEKARAADFEVFVDQDLSQIVRHVGKWEFEHQHCIAIEGMEEEAG